MKSLRCGGRQFLTLHPAGFDESEHCGGYAGVMRGCPTTREWRQKWLTPPTDDAENGHRSLSNQKLNIVVKPNIAPWVL
jgi:hypothetical protein